MSVPKDPMSVSTNHLKQGLPDHLKSRNVLLFDPIHAGTDSSEPDTALLRNIIAKKDFNEDDLRVVFELCQHIPGKAIKPGSKLASHCIIAASKANGAFLFALLNSGENIDPKIWELMLYNSLEHSEDLGIPIVLLSFITNHKIKINPNFEKNKDTLLMKAAATGHSMLVKYLLELRADPNYVSLAGESFALHRCIRSKASEEDIIETLQALIKHGADITLEFNDAQSALFEAINQKKEKVFAFLLEQITEKQLYTRNRRNVSLLAAAAAFGTENMFSMLAKKGGKKIFDICGTEAMALRIRTVISQNLHKLRVDNRRPQEVRAIGTDEELQLYIKQGNTVAVYHHLMKVRVTKTKLNNFLELAVQSRKLEIAQLLLASGASPEAVYPKTKEKNNASNPWEEFYAQEIDNQHTAFWRALEDMGLDFSKPIDKRNEVIEKLLIQAMLQKEMYFFRALKKVAISFSNINAVSLQKVYQVAKENHLQPYVDLLKPWVEMPKSITAARVHFKKVKARFVNFSDWIDLQFQLRPKLLAAIGNNDVDSVLDLVSKGADINFGGHCWAPNTREYVYFQRASVNVDSVTPLHLAVMQPHAETMTRLLLDLGASVKSSNLHTQLYWKQPLFKLLHMNLFIHDENELHAIRKILIKAELDERLAKKPVPSKKPDEPQKSLVRP